MKETLVKIKLSDVESNPNRDLKFNPLNPDKLSALVSSISETGFWSNVIVRPHPDKKGKYQLSYGHHRLQAAINAGITEAEFVVRDLDENMILKMMELENSEDYRYCPLSLLESVKAVVLALAAGRIAPFYRVEDGTLPPEGDPERYKGTRQKGERWTSEFKHEGTGKTEYIGTFDTQKEAAQAFRKAVKGRVLFSGSTLSVVRYAPRFTPTAGDDSASSGKEFPYTAADVGAFLGRVGKNRTADENTRAALDALYLLEVKAITTAMIRDMNWAQLGKFVAETKAKRERVILTEKKTKEQLAAIAEKSRREQEEHRAKEKKAKEERAALVKKMAEAKREEDAKKAQALKARIEAKEAEIAEQQETFEAKQAVSAARIAEVKKQEAEAKIENEYLPIAKEVDCIVHLLEHKDAEERIKALARKSLNANDRQRVRNAAISIGTWYKETVAEQFLPPLSVRDNLEEYRRREAIKHRTEEQTKETK